MLPISQAPTKRYFEDIQVGEAIPPLMKSPITHLQLVRYAGVSGTFIRCTPIRRWVNGLALVGLSRLDC
jgi:hypothetical protein